MSRRSITVDQPDPKRLVSMITLDHGDGRVERLFAHKNDTFSLAWICQRAQDQDMTQLTLTLVNKGLPDAFLCEGRAIRLQRQSMKIPDWARRKLFRDVIRLAKRFGWQGECPEPTEA